jgi:hypothetical protein
VSTYTVDTLGCGCEVISDDRGAAAFLSWCARHTPGWRARLWICGECSFASLEFERLERHVYAVHLGAEVA